ncbi:MAG: GNAT family N-acetyltransferase [bacterium]|nr:GNAT family N-acetyltransferase [bacterium]
MNTEDHEAAVALGRALPEYFNDQGIAEMKVEIPQEDGTVAEVDAKLVGFVTWAIHEGTGWIAVSGAHHRRGIGRRLGESIDYEPYERTRTFYRSVGFRDLRSVTLDNPGMPEMLTLQKRIDAAD